MLRRPALAVVAMLVWLLGVELGPGLHIARHADLGHHHHGAGEASACSSDEHGHEHHVASVGRHEHDAGPAGKRGHETEAGHHEHDAELGHHEHHAELGHHEHDAELGHHEHHAETGHHEHAEPLGGHHELIVSAEHLADDDAAVERHEHAGPQDHGALALAAGEAALPVHEHAATNHDIGSAPHGAGSLAHRDLVPLTPPLVLPPIASAPWRSLEVTSHLRVAPRERAPESQRARGPPSHGSSSEPLSLA